MAERARLPGKGLQWTALAVLALGSVGLDPGWLLGAFSLALVLAAALKLREARNRSDRRLVALLQLVCCGLQAAQRPELLPSLLQLLAVLLSLAGLLQLETGQALPWRLLLRRSLQVLAAALPIALVLVLLVPRIGPFGSGLGGPSARARTGLSDGLDPGSISRLVADDGPAARVAFGAEQPPPPAQRYWRVLVHPRFDGRRWWRLEESEAPPPVGREPGGPRAREQTWLVEPSPFTAVPWSGGARSADPALQANPRGELQLQRPAGERRSYRLWENEAPENNPGTAGLGPGDTWRWQPPQPLELALPGRGNPRLQALGRRWAALPDPEQRLQAAERWFRSQPFRYSLTPGTLDGADGLDRFLFDEQLGFCGHYASAFSALMRAADVPSRVVSGYLGGRWVVPLGGARYLELRQSDAHAWSEVWLPQRGWQRVDPSSWIGGANGLNRPATARRAEGSALAPLHWLQRQWWGLDMAWSRWWLGFDAGRQQALLQWLLGPQQWALGAVILTAVTLSTTLGLVLLARTGRSSGDPEERDLAALLLELRRLGIRPQPGDTLEQLVAQAGRNHPPLAGCLDRLARCHARRRFGPAGDDRHWQRRWRASWRQLKRRQRGAIRHQMRPWP